MNRELKFRAWIKKRKGYRELDQLVFNNQGIEEVWVFPKDDEIQQVYSPLDVVVEQYTGLADKNGKEIYEGDIVEEDIDFNSKMTDGTFRYKVYWNEDELCWSLDPIGPESIHNDLWELNSSCRVLGNIHEPPKDFRPEHLKRMGVTMVKGGEE